MSQNDVYELIADPAKYFSNPKELATSDELARESKILALKQWDADVRQLQVATDENMAASSHASLNDVHEALRSLGYEPDGDNPGSDKSGHLE